ncbi:MAG TPA: NADH-quinone oxidoreductase subunit M [Candidatus Omnitrophota bacterium]|nr:NADH-quinone oxidoreductase subunit M [Candidatus Omnitrophota bacterium]
MIVTLLPFIAFLGAILTLFTPSKNLKALQGISLASSAICLAAVLYLFCTWDFSQAGFQHVRTWDFFAQAGIWYQTGLDGTNLVFCLLNGLVTFAGAWIAIRTTSRLKEYLFYYLLLTGCMFAVFTALNVFFLYVFYEMTLIPVFAMMGIAGIRAKKENAAIRVALYMTAGAVVGLFALLNLYDILGPGFLDLTQTQTILTSKAALLTPETQKWLAALLIVGFGVMTTLFPLHSWSPAFYSASPVSLAMVHAGVKVGPYILLRTAVSYLPEGFQFWSPWIAGLALAGILYGGFAALRQKNLRDLAAFSSISHMGTLFVAFAALNTASLSAGILLVFAHGLMTACFFALIGILEDRGQTDEINAFSGLGKSMPFFAVCFMLTAMASSGIPGFANFPGELMVFVSAWKSFPWTVAAGILGVLLTAVYMIRAVQALCFGQDHPRASTFKDIVCFSEKIPFLILLISLVIFGIFPAALLKVIQPAIEALL